MRYKISDLAKLLDVSTNTVRRYEDMGYISAVRDENSGYRYYDDDGIFGVLNAKMHVKYGFSHEQIAKMQHFSLEHQGQGCGDRIPADQTANGFGLQGILFPLGLFHRSCSFLPRRGGRAAKKAPGYAPGLWATGCHPKLTFQTTRGWEAAGDTPEPLSSPIQTNCWLRNFTESAHGSRALTASREYLVSEESISFALG